jgi:uncharacterized protein YjbI with pentapeptide repeats
VTIGPFALLSELKAVNLFESKITNTDMSYSKVSGSINNSILANVDFENACLDSALLCKAEIKRCNFSKSKPVINVDDAV